MTIARMLTTRHPEAEAARAAAPPEADAPSLLPWQTCPHRQLTHRLGPGMTARWWCLGCGAPIVSNEQRWVDLTIELSRRASGARRG